MMPLRPSELSVKFCILQGSIQSLFVLSHDVLLTYGSDDQLLSLWETRDMPQQPTATIKVTFRFEFVHKKALGSLKLRIKGNCYTKKL